MPRHTRRAKKRSKTKKGSDWNKKMMKVYHEMKRKDSSVRLCDAMRKASDMRKKGLL
jgi:hypothetical protein